MVRTTRSQRQALLRVFKRAPLAMPYRAWRATVQPTFGCDGAIAVPWCGMWLCIERDGYTHS